MKLRTKVSILVALFWALSTIGIYVSSQLVIKESFLNLEAQSATSNLERIQEGIQRMEDSVNSALGSWAIWDDTYYFMTNKNQAYIDSNLKINSFTSSDIDMVLYFDTTGNPFYSVVADADRKKPVPLPAGLADYLTPNSKIVYQPDVNSQTQGIIAIPSGLLIFASHAIVTSNKTGPVHGTLVMARFFTAKSLEQLINLTKVQTNIYTLNNIKNNPNLLNYYQQLQHSDSILVRPNNKMLIAYSLLRDIDNHPIALIRAELPRNIYQIGLKTINYYNTLSLMSSVTLLAVFWIAIHSIIVRRLEKLKSNIISVGPNAETLDSLSKDSNDEVSSVAALYHHATHDPLTGLGNRHLIHQAFQNRHKIMLPDNKIVMLFIDIDNFKFVNDTLGHEVGDNLLKYIARQLTSSLRYGDLAVRLGGDEFVVMLFDIHPNIIDTIIMQIFSLLRKETTISGHNLNITCSIGISIYPDNGDTIPILLKHADIALYHAKESGKNQYHYYSHQLTVAIQEASRKELELQKAIDNSELCLYYQPIFDTFNKKIICIEALIRWQHPERGLLPAADIIPLAEKSGLIIPIGKWVLKTACKQMKEWQNQGLCAIPIAVNLSLLQIKNLSVNKLISETLDETGLDPHLLELELTETSYIEINESILHELHLLKTRGIRLAVDDFGVGYSGLAYLRRLPISKLKIDQSFIRDIFTDIDDRAITLAIIAIAHQLNLEVVAEGVENENQYEFLKNNNVDAVQGNYFCRPLDKDHLVKLLEQTETDDVTI